MTETLALDCSGFQIHGTRAAQNDSYATTDVAAFVADGVGGSDGARSTADAAVSFYCELSAVGIDADQLLQAPRAFGDTRTRLPGATTLAGAILDGERLWFVAHGDSSFLHIRDGELLARNIPHNSAGLRAALELPVSATASMSLTRVLSSHPVGDSEVRVARAEVGDTVILLTDGFASLISTADMVALAATAGRASDALDALLAVAARQPAEDNATCVVARVEARATTTTDLGGHS